MPPTSFKSISGHCECGSISYEVKAPAKELYHCHCSRCRRLHGAFFATYAYQIRDDLVIKDNHNQLKTYKSPLASWHFCGRCGCHLFAEHEQNPGAIWYMVATLQDGARPGHPADSESHIFIKSKSCIEVLTTELPQFDGYAPVEHSITARKTSMKNSN